MNAPVMQCRADRGFLYEPGPGVSFSGYDIYYSTNSEINVIEKPGLFVGILLAGRSCTIHAGDLGEIAIPVARPVLINFGEQTLCSNTYRRGDFCAGIGVHLDFAAANQNVGDGLSAVISKLRDRFNGHSDIEILPDIPVMKALAEAALSLPVDAKSYDAEMRALLVGFLAATCRGLERPGFAGASLTETGKARAERVARHLRGNLTCTPSLRELSELAAVNPGTLTENFRGAFGKTIFAYFRELRLTEAQRILRCERTTVTETALRVGFNNPTAFATAYRRYFGHPPSHEQRKT